MNEKDLKSLKWFRFWGLVTTFLTIFLIWVGGWVRSTGSGMGCPDWPKCFDVWVPPTSEAQLPVDYLQYYVELRKKKNERVAKVLSKIGFGDLAEKIKNDPSVNEHEPFNAYKTWTEYVNRLIGVLDGIFIFITLILSWRVRHIDNRIFKLSLAGFIGVGFEGWLGSLVVSTNLMPSFITVHMVVAMLILVVLISAVVIAYTYDQTLSDKVYVKRMGLVWSGVGVSLIVLLQIIFGTQVRESVDLVARQVGDEQRELWVEFLPGIYKVHRFFYYFVAAGIMYWVWQLRGSVFKIKSIKIFSTLLLAILIIEILMGISMHRYSIPPVLQPLHLLFGTLLFSVSYTITAILFLKKPKIFT